MSEETHNAASLGPLAIQTAVLVSGAMGWMLTVCLCFCVTDLNDILNTPTGLPAAQIFLNVGGKTGGTIMWGLATLVQFFTGCSAMLADTRMAYAFARDDALPFSSYALPSPPQTKAFKKKKKKIHIQTLITKQAPFQSPPKNPHPPQRRLVRRLLQHSPQHHRHRLHTNRHRNLQHHSARPGPLLRLRDLRAPVLQGPGEVCRRAFLAGEMGESG